MIWQPTFYGRHGYTITLNRVFAKRMLDTRLTPEDQRKANQLALEELSYRSIKSKTPIGFYEDSALATRFLFDSGVRLEVEEEEHARLLESRKIVGNLSYLLHLPENREQEHTLMLLFNSWVDFAGKDFSKNK